MCTLVTKSINTSQQLPPTADRSAADHPGSHRAPQSGRLGRAAAAAGRVRAMLLCRMDMPIEKMNLNCKLEMIAGGGPAAARPPVPVTVTSPSPSQLKSARVCTLSHNITQFERRKGRSAGPAAAAASAAARPVPLAVTSPGESESVQVPTRPGAGRPGAPGPSRAAFRLTISGRPSVAVRVTGTVTVRGPPWHSAGTVTVPVAPG